MATNKPNPNLTQVQYATLSARVSELTGYETQQALYVKCKPKETAAIVAAKKAVKAYEDACNAASAGVRKDLAAAKAIAQEALLFQTADKALAAVKTLEGKFRG